jgi:hypothetical protein
MSEHNGSRGVNPAEIENLDEWELAICYKCGFIDDWSEIPGGQCAFSGEGLNWCPECGDIESLVDYTPEKALIIAEQVAFKKGERKLS